MKQNITKRQREIYEFIYSCVSDGGIPPSIREIGEKFNIRSTNGVEGHLLALEKSGLIVRERGKSRSIYLHSDKPIMATIPILGRVAAGSPVLSPENMEGEVAVDSKLLSISNSNVFAVKVVGESMINAHIVDGDLLIVRAQDSAQNGDIIVALVEGEATVKRYIQEANRIRLQPENANLKPLYLEDGDFQVVGKAIGMFRRI